MSSCLQGLCFNSLQPYLGKRWKTLYLLVYLSFDWFSRYFNVGYSIYFGKVILMTIMERLSQNKIVLFSYTFSLTCWILTSDVMATSLFLICILFITKKLKANFNPIMTINTELWESFRESDSLGFLYNNDFATT